VTSSLLLVGNWIRYAGAKAKGGIFGVSMFGQILIGLAQPFCLSAPTRYSDLWFSDRGRTSATAVATLANPLGAALGQLINSVWATKPSEVPDMVLWISIMVRIQNKWNGRGWHLRQLTGNGCIASIIFHPSATTNTTQRIICRG